MGNKKVTVQNLLVVPIGAGRIMVAIKKRLSEIGGMVGGAGKAAKGSKR